jgi:hypothetical protein
MVTKSPPSQRRTPAPKPAGSPVGKPAPAGTAEISPPKLNLRRIRNVIEAKAAKVPKR